MKQVNGSERVLLVCKALGSEIRMKIIELLKENGQMNLNELSERLGVTNGAMTAHIKMLSDAGIIRTEQSSGKRGLQKSCSLAETQLLLRLDERRQEETGYELEIPIGQYAGYQASAPCGLMTAVGPIGAVNDSRYFDAPERVNAGVVWLSDGYLEYRIPNYLKTEQTLSELQLSFEAAAGAPGKNEGQECVLSVLIDGALLAEIQITGGPKLFTVTVNGEGCSVNGQRSSAITAAELSKAAGMTLRLLVRGGMVLTGRGFGSCGQHIKTVVKG